MSMLQFDERSTQRFERALVTHRPQQSFSFDDLLGIVRHHRRLIAGVTAVVLVATIAFVLLSPPRYRSTAQILIDPRDLQVVKNELKPSTSSTDVGIAVVETEARVVSSETVLKRAILTLGLDKDEEFTSGWPGLKALLNLALEEMGFPSAAPNSAEMPLLQAMRTLQKRLYVLRPERTYIVDVSVETNDADKSARVAEGIARAYLDEQAGARMEAARATSDSLSSRLDELRKRLSEAEDKVEAYKAAHNIVGNGRGLVNEQQLLEINTQLISARGVLAAQRARYDQILAAHGELDALPEAVQSSTLRALRDRYAVAASKLAEVSAQLMPGHPFVVTARQQQAKIEKLIEEEIERLAAAAKMDYERAAATETSLEKSLEALSQQALDTNEALVKERDLERDAHASRAVYEAALIRTRETRELEQINPTNARIITHASPPNAKSWPPRLVLMLPLALVLGLALGLGLALVKERSEVRQYADLRVIRRIGLYA